MIKIYTEEQLYGIIGENIKYYRQLYNIVKSGTARMTQERLAELANISTSLVGNMESNRVSQGISLYTLYKISNILLVPADRFFIPTNEKKPEDELRMIMKAD